MGKKHYEITECTCDRCGNVETFKGDNDAPKRQDSTGLLLILGSDTLFGPSFAGLVERNGYPESAHEVRLWLCATCRDALATFLNEKK